MAVTDFTLIRRSVTSRPISTAVVIIALAAGAALMLLLVDLHSSTAAATNAATQPTPEALQQRENIDRVSGRLTAAAGATMLGGAVLLGLALCKSMGRRRRSIAVLRLLGWSRARVGAIVLTEAAMIGLLGALAGVAIWIIGSRAAAQVLQETAGVVVPPRLDPAVILTVMLCTIALATLAGVLPAFIAGRTPIARNLNALD